MKKLKKIDNDLYVKADSWGKKTLLKNKMDEIIDYINELRKHKVIEKTYYINTDGKCK